MPVLKFTGNTLGFIDELKSYDVVVEAFSVKGDTINVTTGNMGQFTTSVGKFLSTPPLEALRKSKGEYYRRKYPHNITEKVDVDEPKSIWKVHKDEPLAATFIKYVEDPNHEHKTFDDFFNDLGIPEEERSDFAVAAMLRQVKELRGLEDAGK